MLVLFILLYFRQAFAELNANARKTGFFLALKGFFLILRVFNILSGDFSLGSPIFARKRYFCENFGVFRLSDVFSTRFPFGKDFSVFFRENDSPDRLGA